MRPPSFLLSFFESAPLVFFILDYDGNMMKTNSFTCNQFGFEENNIMGSPFPNLLDPYSVEKCYRMLENVREGVLVSDWELNHRYRRGIPVLVNYTAFLMSDDNGQPSGIGLIGDVMDELLSFVQEYAQLQQDYESLKEENTSLLDELRVVKQNAYNQTKQENWAKAFVRVAQVIYELTDKAIQKLATVGQEVDTSENVSEARKFSAALFESQNAFKNIQQLLTTLPNIKNFTQASLPPINLNAVLEEVAVQVASQTGIHVTYHLEEQEAWINAPEQKVRLAFHTLLVGTADALPSSPKTSILIESTVEAEMLSIHVHPLADETVPLTFSWDSPHFRLALDLLNELKSTITFSSKADALPIVKIKIPINVEQVTI